MKETLSAVEAPRGTCPLCGTAEQLLYHCDALDEGDDRRICAPCVRALAKRVKRSTPCDRCGTDYAWRNPKHRRNEFLCGRCHAESGEGVVLNKWFPRESVALGVRQRELCAERNNSAGTTCMGEVKPRGPQATPLCNRHAGKTSWGDEFRNRD